MRKRSWMTVLVAAAICLAFAAPAAAAGDVRLFAGHDSVVDTIAEPTTCPEGASWRYSGAGTGRFLHLGRTSVSVTHCTFVDMASGTGTFGPGTITLTAANGDELHLVQWGTFRLVNATEGLTSVFNMGWIVVGGTGRFDDAKGSGMTRGSSLLSTGITAATYLGLIDY
jgi:hypothetical protein